MWGEDLDGYEVEEKVGADEAAVFLRAVSRGRGGGTRPVLLSALHPHVSGQTTLIRAFVSASKRSMSVDDPRLLSVESVNAEGDRKYRACAFVRGWSWPSLLEREPTLTASACAWVAFQMASAIATERRRASWYVHGLLGPEALYVLPDSSIRIAPPLLDASAFLGSRNTAFIAPEVLAGEAPGPSADVYGVAHLLWKALGVVMLREGTGTAADLAQRHPALCEALLPALSSKAGERPAEAAELVRRLGAIALVHAGAGDLARFVARLGDESPDIVGVPPTGEVPTTLHADRAPALGSDAGTGPERPPAPALRRARSAPKLCLVGGIAPRELSLGGSASRWVVGRGRSADLVLQDVDASREHFEIVRTAGTTFCAYDLGSKNGLSVNGREVHEHPLAAGDELRAGNTTLRFEW